MTKTTYSNTTIEFQQFNPGTHLTNVRCRNVKFRNCNIGMLVHTPNEMVRISNTHIERCVATRCSVAQTIIEDCTVNHLRAEGAPLFIWNTVFRRVILQGRIRRLIVRIGPRVERIWLDTLAREYGACDDWALDIQDAQLDDVSLEGIPGNRIRCSPYDAILARDQAQRLALQDPLNPNIGSLVVLARNMLAGPFDSIVIPSWQGSKDFNERQDKLERWAQDGFVRFAK